MIKYQLLPGDCREVLKTLSDNSVDSVVTDPPYELGFMGKAWDSTGVAYDANLWREVFRVLKPGGQLLAFAGSRTYHRMACAIEDAGFQIRDQIMWVYGSGFPKSHNIGKAVDKLQGNSEYEGWGTALKPAHEPICMARKPLDGTVAENALKWGVGGLNIDACRVGAGSENFDKVKDRLDATGKLSIHHEGGNLEALEKLKTLGRFPANLIHDGSQQVLDLFPANAGAADPVRSGHSGESRGIYGDYAQRGDDGATFYADSGSAARFFYCAKASRADRNEGCENLPSKEWSQEGACIPERKDRPFEPSKNNHPTVKPTALMRYLVRLVTPKDGLVLDPFNGSGSTGKAAILEGMQYIGIEMDLEYIKIAEARINAAKDGKPSA